MKPANALFSSLGTTIFETMSRLAQEHGAVNLGQGFPEDLEPPAVLEAAARHVLQGPHQYPSMMGIPALRQAVAAANKRFYGLDVDWQTEVMVTSGATEALADCLFGLIEPGDEVVLIEPLYDSYLPIVKRAGGVPKLVRLQPPRWDLPREDLAAAFSDRTKLIMLNSPMNPCAKVFDEDELAFIADLLQRHDAYAVCDEVYEHLTFDGRRHVPLMTLPGMRERCVRIGSAGKTFSVTSWKVGYITAPPHLLGPIAKTHQFLTFTTPTGLQAAVAEGLGMEDAYFEGLARDMQARRDHLADGLRGIGFEVLDCAGTYFLTTDVRPLGWTGTDADFCLHLTTKAGVAAVPVSAFFAGEADRHFVRFCFAKNDAALDEALSRLSAHFAR
ncbi:Aspartate aminotransferase [Caenispirillum salinarum AK4]|uniref:Aspartate aminotransferase n=1 Tax=Caenispirillum salinarum AK4 TaxID=1238182 RepID=K9HHJ2_9PROT|nr:aminotransferase [Caenispirillum salinarum]EKV28086.1 Aspartate aminotransferase [Caenispirillum salinarum AK4]